MTQQRGKSESVMPARCGACGVDSEPRPLGQTPIGWDRETVSGQGHYYCPDCTPRLTALRDALDDAIRQAFCAGPRGEGWYVTGEPTGPDPAIVLDDPNKMRFLARIQQAAWDVVKERVE